ncbi:hypothetical protein LY76DRAFT_610375 [Colletotrichum caudatum]|nr:hypothetical protein LY76DRAFT_610375 [Colletotrichum caudatum]
MSSSGFPSTPSFLQTSNPGSPLVAGTGASSHELPAIPEALAMRNSPSVDLERTETSVDQPGSKQNPKTPERKTSDDSSSPLSPPPAVVGTPPWLRQAKQDPPWTTEDFRAMDKFFRSQFGPFALGTIVRMLGRRDFSDVAAHIINYRQSALAVEVTRSQRNHPGHDAPISHKTKGRYSVFGGVHDMKVRVYDMEGDLLEVYEVGSMTLYR